MTVSVVVPAYNSESTIEACLRAIRAAAGGLELIVSDDASSDRTVARATPLASRIVASDTNRGPAGARLAGAAAASGDLLVFIDADVVVRPDSISKIQRRMEAEPQIAAVTGRFGEEHPNSNFFSQYKNLYMNFVFERAPDSASFIFGSIFAVRRGFVDLMPVDLRVGEDTAFGQVLARRGATVRLMKDLEVVHLKRYSAGSFVANDFRVPFNWARVFVRHKGWRDVVRPGTGFAHASRSQLMSLVAACSATVAAVLGATGHFLFFAGLWALLNASFLRFLARRRGVVFGAVSALVTFLDHLVMSGGTLAGAAVAVIRR